MGNLSSTAYTLVLGAVCAFLPDRFSSWSLTNPRGLARLTFACVLVVSVTLVALAVNTISGFLMLGEESFHRTLSGLSEREKLLQIYVPMMVGLLAACSAAFVLVLVLFEHLLPYLRVARAAHKASAVLIIHEEARRITVRGAGAAGLVGEYLLRVRELDVALKAYLHEPTPVIPDSGFRNPGRLWTVSGTIAQPGHRRTSRGAD